MQIVPLQAVPAQSVNITLGGQDCLIAVYQKSTGVYLDLSVGALTFFTCVSGLNGVLIVREAYIGFVGDLAFLDTQGKDDPDYTGFGTNGRWQLLYLDPVDVPAGVV